MPLPFPAHEQDSTRLRSWLTCKRRYYYEHALSLEPRDATAQDLVFGHAVHAGLEAWEHRIAAGWPSDLALADTLEEAWCASEAWPTNLAMCAPPKDRAGLVRLLTWYAAQYPPDEDVIKPISLDRVAPATEVRFRVRLETLASALGVFLPYLGHWPQPPTLVGRFDGFVRNECTGEVLVRERKTTKKTLSPYYWKTYSPDIQVSLYALVGRVLAPQLKIKGVLLDAMQIGVTFARFERMEIVRTPEQSAESLFAIARAFREMSWSGLSTTDEWQLESRYPLNEAACLNHGRPCVFRDLCNTTPSARADTAMRDYQVRPTWDPLEGIEPVLSA